MAVQTRLIAGESCDHCGEKTEDHLFCFKWRDVNGHCQLWLHKKCLQELVEKFYRLEAKARREAEASCQSNQ